MTAVSEPATGAQSCVPNRRLASSSLELLKWSTSNASTLDPSFVDTFRRIIEGFPEQTALVDHRWNILAVNRAWTKTAELFGYGELMPGTNYLQFCESKAAEGHSAAAIAAGGIAEIDAGTRESFSYIYHGRDRWEGFSFQLCVSRLEVGGQTYATISRHDITELVQLRQMRARFSDSLIEGQAEERQRVARDVHDSTIQTLVALGLTIGRLKRSRDPDVPDTIVAEMEQLLIDAQAELRSIAYLAHPPVLKEMGLIEALQALADGYGRRTGLRVSLNVDSFGEVDWRSVEIVLYRVVQEALSNIHRHAVASEVTVGLVARRGMLHAVIADNGIGMTRHGPDGVGLPSMRARLAEHGGRLSIRSGVPGTIVIASLPPKPQLRAVGDLTCHS